MSSTPTYLCALNKFILLLIYFITIFYPQFLFHFIFLCILLHAVHVIRKFSSVAQSRLTLCSPTNRNTPDLPVHHHLPEFTQTQCPSSRWCHPAISSSVVPFSCPQSLPASGSFPMRTLHMRWPKYWSFSFSISPSNEHPGLISFWMDWLDLLAVQGTLKNLLQHHSSKASILWPSAFFIVNSHIHTWLLEKP